MNNYNNTLQTNNTNLQNILTAINNLPEAGTSGGGIETCTVNINNHCYNKGARIIDLSYSTLNNNKIIGIYENSSDTGYEDTTSEKSFNVICGTTFRVYVDGYSFINTVISDITSTGYETMIPILTSFNEQIFITPTMVNSIINIEVWDDD